MVNPFIEAEKQGGHSVKGACELPKVSRAAFYVRRSGEPGPSAVRDAELTGKIIGNLNAEATGERVLGDAPGHAAGGFKSEEAAVPRSASTGDSPFSRAFTRRSGHTGGMHGRRMPVEVTVAPPTTAVAW